MKKRILGCLLVAGLVLAQVLTVGAKGSKGDQFDIITDGYDIEIIDPNPDPGDLPEDAKEQLDGKTPISPTVKVEPTGTSQDGTHRIEFYVPNLTEDMIPPLYGYYYLGDGTWHIIESTEINYDEQTVVFEFDEMPIYLIIFAELIDVDALGLSPKTGVESTWMVWMCAAAVLGGAAVVMSKKKRA